ncbi:MAG: hypothetical protein A2427_01030 [Candidatus Nealsonbacteria bacterium RIFOXYC1_FULL_40_7]|uniref:Glycosyltransferase n=1 Tax=Candidatus Nealsonbacteria bacterium RIFOXYC1_FULL_40_7 TaxID=1801678 RepID=A0A1G2ENF7_9BACT|nr:MAG: hypothetical protein A2427_01030 [Candidatus Nealsonbacteria bacterium RIFOXYC1_FULL_40_7]
MTKGILYYTDNRLNMRLALTCRKWITKSGLPITSVTLKPTNFGKNISLPLLSSYETLYKQILTGLMAMTEDVVFFCEHDDLYHPSCFDFEPTDKKTFYYNGNYWYVRLTDGLAIHYNVSPLSGLCAYRNILITHFKERVALIKKRGFDYYMGFEPMTHGRIRWKNWYDFEVYQSPVPTVDFCHNGNLTKKRWDKDQFRRKPKFWEESDYKHIPNWPNLPQIMAPFFPIKK